MRLDFNVLWVDDQPDFIRAQVRAIASRMAAEGFELRETIVTSTHDAVELLASDLFTDEIDLVLVDWDLGGGAHGQDTIARVREKVRYRDVIFYSALAAPDDLRRAAFDAGLEGVYCAQRTGLVEEVVGVFEALVKKVLDVDHVRGIVMGASCDIDNMVIECLKLMHERLDDPGRKIMLGRTLKRVQKKMKKLAKAAGKLEAADDLEPFFRENQLFTSDERLIVLAAMLEDKPFGEVSGSRDSVIEYRDGVVPERNKLGHKMLVPEGKPRSLVDAAGGTVTVQHVRDLRRRIIELRSHFRSLLDALRKR